MANRSHILFFFAFLLSIFHLQGLDFALKDKFRVAHVGDYIVTSQDKNYSILLIKEKGDTSIVFEEISFPETMLDPKKMSWQAYLDNKAPNHSSWILFEMSLITGELIECYSVSQRSWISLEESEHFLSKFFCLPLKEVPFEERKRIGPPPKDREDDHRAFWYPPLFIHGKKKEKPLFDIRKSKWAPDGSLLSNSSIEMFFYADDRSYPFPIWIEVNNGHYGFKIRAQDTGKNLKAAYERPLPKRPPLIAGNFAWRKDGLELPIKCPSYAKDFDLESIDISDPSFIRTPLQHSLITTDKKELYILKLSKEEILSRLLHHHRYRLALTPKGQNTITIETEESFLLP